MAIASPLLEVSIEGAKGVLFNIVGGPDMSMSEVNEAAQIIAQAAEPDANIIFGATIKEDLVDMVKVSVIATGFDEMRERLREYAGVGMNQMTPRVGFGVQPAAPRPQVQSNSNQHQPVVNSQQDNHNDDNFQNMADDNNEEDNDLEIPAFLRQGR
jgi:cell division protein FtsZ